MSILFILVLLRMVINMPPLDHGYSIEMKEKSVNTFSFPDGEYWSQNL